LKNLFTAFALLGFLALGACASTIAASTGTPTPAMRVYAAETDYYAVAGVVQAYVKLPACDTAAGVGVPCKMTAVASQLRKAHDAVMAAFASAQTVARTPGVTDNQVTLALTATTNAVAAVTKIVATYGIT
jgi:hypothetical protein